MSKYSNYYLHNQIIIRNYKIDKFFGYRKRIWTWYRFKISYGDTENNFLIIEYYSRFPWYWIENVS